MTTSTNLFPPFPQMTFNGCLFLHYAPHTATPRPHPTQLILTSLHPSFLLCSSLTMVHLGKTTSIHPPHHLILIINSDCFYCPSGGCSHSYRSNSPPFLTQTTLLHHLKTLPPMRPHTTSPITHNVQLSASSPATTSPAHPVHYR